VTTTTSDRPVQLRQQADYRVLVSFAIVACIILVLIARNKGDESGVASYARNSNYLAGVSADVISNLNNPNMKAERIADWSNTLAGFKGWGMVTTNPSPEGTNMLVFTNDVRGALDLMVDEGLPCALEKAISLPDLRHWATNAIDRQRKLEREDNRLTPHFLPTNEIPERLLSIDSQVPKIKFSRPEIPGTYLIFDPDHKAPSFGFYRDSDGNVVAVSIEWYIYAIVIGPESFVLHLGPPMYQWKMANGIYSYRGYK
jgi:hypothetical protein